MKKCNRAAIAALMAIALGSNLILNCLHQLILRIQQVKEMTQQQPTVSPKVTDPKFGFNEYAERLNGRAAMIGFALALAIEYVSGQGLLAWLGLN